MAWPSAPLSELATFIRGVTFKPTDVSPAGVPVLRTKNVQLRLELDDVIRIPPHLIKRKDQILEYGDTLISSANSWNLVGKCCWVPRLPEPMAIGGFVTALRAGSSVQPRYLYHWFASPAVQATIRSFGNQTTNIANLNLERCGTVPVPLPPIEEQRRIADILDRADGLRTKRREALTLLDDLTQSIFRDMFGDLDSHPFREQVLENLLAETQLGLVRSGAEFGIDFPTPYVRMNAISKTGELELAGVLRTKASPHEVARYSLRAGDLLFNTRNSRELVGKSALVRSGHTGVYNNNIMRIRVIVDTIRPGYLAQYFLSASGMRELDRRKSGTTNVWAIYFKDLKTMKVPVPPLKLQDRFCRCEAAVHAHRTALRAQLTEADRLFVSLQQRAFAGGL